jgi:sporulation protein YlmC with PRC-barrel domain
VPIAAFPGVRVVYIELPAISIGLIRTSRDAHSLIDEERRSEGGHMPKTITAAFVAVLAAGMAMAEAQIVTNYLMPGQLRVSEMTGAAVYDNQNKEIGAIKDIVLDPDGRVAAVVLNVKGTLGLAKRYVAVSIGDLKITDTGTKPRFTVELLKDQLRTAQTYDLHEAKLDGASTPPPPDDRPPPADRER